jgi:hypothetical protein
MKKKNRKLIYVVVLVGLLLKFIITGIIVIIARNNKEERQDKLSDPAINQQNTIIVQTIVSTKLYPLVTLAQLKEGRIII